MRFALLLFFVPSRPWITRLFLSCGVRSALSCFSFFLIPGRVFRFVCVFWWRFPARAFLFSFGCVRFALMFLGFRHPGAIFFYFFVVSVCTFRIAAFFVFTGSLDVRFELLFSFAFALERAIFVFLPSRIVLFVFRLFSLYAAVLQGTFHIHPFWVGCVWGTGWCFYRPPGLRVVSSPVTGRTFRIAVFSSRLCFLSGREHLPGGENSLQSISVCLP